MYNYYFYYKKGGIILVKAAAIQVRCDEKLDKNFKEIEKHIKSAVSQDAKIICLPEYFSINSEMFSMGNSFSKILSDNREDTLNFLDGASQKYGIIISGNVLEEIEEKYYNVVYIYENGSLIGQQVKIHPTRGEMTIGITPGREIKVFKTSIGFIGVLVCADVLYPEMCRILGLMNADIVLNPVVSFYKDVDLTKEARRSMYISRAYDNSYYIIKAGGIGRSFTGIKIVGRSLIVAPWNILKSSTDENKEEVVIADLDLDLLRDIRKENYSLVDRSPEAYKLLIKPMDNGKE